MLDTAGTGTNARSCENPAELCLKRLVRDNSSDVEFHLWSGHICWLCAKLMHRLLSTLLVFCLTIAPAASPMLHALSHEQCADSNCQFWWRATSAKKGSSVDLHQHCHHACSHSTGNDDATNRRSEEHSTDSRSAPGSDSLPFGSDDCCRICVTLFAPATQTQSPVASEEQILHSILSSCCSPVLMSLRELPYESRGPPAA